MFKRDQWYYLLIAEGKHHLVAEAPVDSQSGRWHGRPSPCQYRTFLVSRRTLGACAA
jgi:hypothetical protein